MPQQYNGSFNAAPSRLNPRIPRPARHDETDSASATYSSGTFFDGEQRQIPQQQLQQDQQGIFEHSQRQSGYIGSLLSGDLKPRTPLDDFLQEDYPNYASRLLAVSSDPRGPAPGLSQGQMNGARGPQRAVDPTT